MHVTKRYLNVLLGEIAQTEKYIRSYMSLRHTVKLDRNSYFRQTIRNQILTLRAQRAFYKEIIEEDKCVL